MPDDRSVLDSVGELREMAARSRIVMETISDAVLTIDERSTILFANQGAADIFGYELEELTGANLTMVMPDYMRRAHEAGLARYVETGQRHISWQGVELPGLHKSGREMTLEVSFGEFVAEDGRHFFTGVARDVTRRKRAERNLATQYELTRILAEAPTTREAIKWILSAVGEGLGWELGALWSVEAGGEGGEDVLRCVELWHASGVEPGEFESMSQGRVFRRGEGLPGGVWESGRPAWFTDFAEEEYPRAAVARRAGLHGAFTFPVAARGRVVGVMEFFSRDVREPDEPLLATMANVGGQLGQVLERKRAEDERARLSEEIIRIQEAQLEELSTPLVPITDRLIAMPLVGQIDARRAQRVIDTLLAGVAERRVPFAIIDITGVPVVDTHVADTLIRAAQSARLLGTEVVLTGIRAGVARTLSSLGFELHGLTTRKTMQEGIAFAFETMRRRAAARKT
jgi:PAS domain S-box-containing protein